MGTLFGKKFLSNFLSLHCYCIFLNSARVTVVEFYFRLLLIEHPILIIMKKLMAKKNLIDKIYSLIKVYINYVSRKYLFNFQAQ